MSISACAWEVALPGKNRYDFPKIEKVGQIKGDDKFAVRLHGNCLNKDGEWEYEPIPSSRDDEFIERCRFATFRDAVLCLENAYR